MQVPQECRSPASTARVCARKQITNGFCRSSHNGTRNTASKVAGLGDLFEGPLLAECSRSIASGAGPLSGRREFSKAAARREVVHECALTVPSWSACTGLIERYFYGNFKGRKTECVARRSLPKSRRTAACESQRTDTSGVLPMVVARREHLFPELPPRSLRGSLRARCRRGRSQRCSDI